MPSRARKVDANQPDIVRALERIGASVFLLSSVGAGMTDLVVGFRGLNFLLECKDGNKTASRRKLTPAQVEFHRDWKGQKAVVTSAVEAVDYVISQERKCRQTRTV